MQLLGLCMRARQLSVGESVIDAIRKKKARLVLYASDASDNTKKRIVDKAHYYEVEAIEVDNSELLSSSIGKSGRVAAAVLSEGFAKKIKEKLGVGDENGKNE